MIFSTTFDFLFRAFVIYPALAVEKFLSGLLGVIRGLCAKPERLLHLTSYLM
jgi:hypothetical protein